MVDDGDAVGELVRLVEVLGGQQNGGAFGDDAADHVPHIVAAARVQSGGGLVQEQQVGRDDQAGGDVQPAPHAAGVRLDQPVGRFGEGERGQQFLGPGAAAARE